MPPVKPRFCCPRYYQALESQLSCSTQPTRLPSSALTRVFRKIGYSGVLKSLIQ